MIEALPAVSGRERDMYYRLTDAINILYTRRYYYGTRSVIRL